MVKAPEMYVGHKSEGVAYVGVCAALERVKCTCDISISEPVVCEPLYEA